MFTILKVRDRLKNYDEDVGWYDNPPGTVAWSINEKSKERQVPSSYVCPMHPEVRQQEPGVCPKCGMKLQPETTGSHEH